MPIRRLTIAQSVVGSLAGICNAMLCYVMLETPFTSNQTRKQARERAHLESRQACEPETLLCNVMPCHGRASEAFDQASKEAGMKQASKQVGKQASKQARGRVIFRQRIYVAAQGRSGASHEASQERRTDIAAGCESPLLHHAAGCKPPLPQLAAPVPVVRSLRGKISSEWRPPLRRRL
jgi:hypothetical protein